MTTISPQLVKELREKTGAGMMDCKKALVECQADLEKAITWLREKGIAKAQKKADRTASNGRVFVASSEKSGAILELNCETDFVATNQDFIDFGTKLVDDLNQQEDCKDLQSLQTVKINGESLSETLSNIVLKVGENVQVSKFEKVTGLSSGYIHSNGKIGVLVSFEKSIDSELSKGIAMHIAALNPQFIDKSEISNTFIDEEKAVLKAQALKEGKPEDIAEKMVIGRLNKHLAEICLVEQAYVKEPSQKVKDLIQDNSILKFIRYQLG